MMTITPVTGHALLEFLVREMGDQFRENETARVHSLLSIGIEQCALPLFGLSDFKSFPDRNTARHRDRKDLSLFVKYFTGH